MQENNGKFAVITGASSGIGYELARVFGKNGYDLLVTSEDDGLQKAAAELQDLGVNVQSVQADLAEYDGVEQLWEAIKSSGRSVLCRLGNSADLVVSDGCALAQSSYPRGRDLRKTLVSSSGALSDSSRRRQHLVYSAEDIACQSREHTMEFGS